VQINPITSYGSGYVQSASGAGRQGGLRALAQDQFSDIDTSGDGSVSQAEFKTALENATGNPSVTDAQASNLFKKIDANGDGSISPAEWSAFQQKMQGLEQGHGHHHHHRASGGADDSQSASQTTQSAISQLFASADANGDGQLSQSELSAWLQNGQSSPSVNTLA
jgi:Ca2+-binding EF-hand superfamily protein